MIDEYVAAQAARTGRTTMTIIQFDAPTDDDWYLRHCPSLPPALIPPFVLYPRGMTALYDAMCRALDEFGAELAAMPERNRPGTVIFAVYTDGKENASAAKADDVRTRVERQIADYGWHVVYLGANQDAVLEGERMGVPRHSSITYNATDHGTRSASESFEVYTASAVSTGKAAFSDEDRERAMQE
jgi:hypothetical protein